MGPSPRRPAPLLYTPRMARLSRLLLPLAAVGGAALYVRGVSRFRDPIRVPPGEAGAVLSPADGLVSFVRRIESGEVRVETLAAPLRARDLTGMEVGEGWLLGLSVGPLDVRFLYAPVDGPARAVTHRESRLNVPLGGGPLVGLAATASGLVGWPADLLGTRGAVENERHTTTLDTPRGEVGVTLVAGVGGLRATSYLRPGDTARAGYKLAFLEEGGLVLLTLPAGITPQVGVGDRVRGAETVVAR